MVFLVPFLIGLSSGVWLYNRYYSRTGGNTLNAAVVGGVGGGLIFLVFLFLAIKFLR